jgi:hypothetical protein
MITLGVYPLGFLRIPLAGVDPVLAVLTPLLLAAPLEFFPLLTAVAHTVSYFKPKLATASGSLE